MSARRRRALPVALVVLASVLAFLAIFALWANRQLLDTDNWTETSSELLDDEAIRTQVGAFLVDELYASVDVEAQVEAALPPRAAPLAGPVAGGLKTLAERAAVELLQRPRAQQLWEEANRRAHERLLQVVEGGGDVVSTEGGDVTLDLKALLGATQERVGVGGAVEERVPDDAAQLKIMESDDLELAQDLVDFLKALAIGLVLVALALYTLAVYLARDWRREALRAVGFGLLAAGALALLARELAGDAVVDALASTAGVEPAVEATWEIGTTLLEEAAGAALIYGLVTIFAAWLAGPTGWAVATRRALAPFLREPRYAYGGLAAIVFLLVAWGPTPALRRPLTALILIGLLTLGVRALRRQTAREYPDARIEDSTAKMRAWVAGLTSRRGGGGGGGDDDTLAELERLGRLRDTGVLDAAEFDREKARLLGRTAPSPG